MADLLDGGRYIPLESICAMALDETDRSMGDMDKYWVLAHRAANLVHRQWEALPKSIVLPVESTMIVYLPPDYDGWTKIGIMDDNGQISTLKINTGLTLLGDNSPRRNQLIQQQINTSIGILTGAPFFFNFFGNGVYYNTPLFGTAGGLMQFGDCTVDELKQVIVLSPDFRYDHIVLEYLSVPFRDKDYKVEAVLTEPIIAFIKWKTGKGPREEFYAASIEARRALPGKRVNLQHIAEVIRATGGMFLKS